MHATHDQVPAVTALILVVVLPLVFIIGGWLVDRRSRAGGAPGFRRLFALAAYSACALLTLLAVLALLLYLPHDFSTSSTLLTLSYAALVSSFWLSCVTAFAVLFFSISGVIVKHVAHRKT